PSPARKILRRIRFFEGALEPVPDRILASWTADSCENHEPGEQIRANETQQARMDGLGGWSAPQARDSHMSRRSTMQESYREPARELLRRIESYEESYGQETALRSPENLC